MADMAACVLVCLCACARYAHVDVVGCVQRQHRVCGARTEMIFGAGLEQTSMAV